MSAFSSQLSVHRSQVIKKHRDCGRKGRGEDDEAGEKRPVEPILAERAGRGGGGVSVEAAEDGGPQVASGFGRGIGRRQSLPKQLLDAIFVVCIHGVIP